MAGRPRTQHKRVAMIVARLTSLQDRMIELIPDQYDDTTIDNSSLPFDDLGRSWRIAVEALMAAVDQVEWLEWLLAQKATKSMEETGPEGTYDSDDVDEAVSDRHEQEADEPGQSNERETPTLAAPDSGQGSGASEVKPS